MAENIPWFVNEPNGQTFQSCLGLHKDKNVFYAYDTDCENRMPTICQDIQVNFRLKGLCKDSKLDKIYKLSFSLYQERRMFEGSIGWNIWWVNTENIWMIYNKDFPSKYMKGLELKEQRS